MYPRGRGLAKYMKLCGHSFTLTVAQYSWWHTPMILVLSRKENSMSFQLRVEVHPWQYTRLPGIHETLSQKEGAWGEVEEQDKKEKGKVWKHKWILSYWVCVKIHVVRMLASEPEEVSFILGTHGRNQQTPESCTLTSTHIHEQ